VAALICACCSGLGAQVGLALYAQTKMLSLCSEPLEGPGSWSVLICSCCSGLGAQVGLAASFPSKPLATPTFGWDGSAPEASGSAATRASPPVFVFGLKPFRSSQ
jgi:hypothetical protein